MSCIYFHQIDFIDYNFIFKHLNKNYATQMNMLYKKPANIASTGFYMMYK